MLVARRPLRQAELESGIILDDRVPEITPATRARGNVLSLCFPLIEIDEDPSGYVDFCHFTALELVIIYSEFGSDWVLADTCVTGSFEATILMPHCSLCKHMLPCHYLVFYT